MAMFSEPASAKPTAPTLPWANGVGGGVGGAKVACTGWERIIARIAKVRIAAAMIGNPYLVMRKLPLWSEDFPLFAQSGRHPCGRCGRRNRRHGCHESPRSLPDRGVRRLW